MKQIQGGDRKALRQQVEAAIKYQNRKDMALIVSKGTLHRSRYVYLQRGKGGSRAVG